jgi:two-component system sensor histidine kinase UhpB
MNILVTDDNPLDRKLLHLHLEMEGHVVVEAGDGVEALQVLESGPRMDAIISDIMMPRMDGYRFCYEVRRRQPFQRMPFVFYTATFTTARDEKFSRELGADEYLRKPATAKVILETLARIIANHALQPAPRPPAAAPELHLVKEYSEMLVKKLEEKNLALGRHAAELGAAEAKFRTLVEQSIVGTYVIQGDRFVYVNPKMEEIFGRPGAELTSRPVLDFITVEEHAKVRENIHLRLEGNIPSIRYRLRMLGKGGALIHAEVHGTRIEYNGGPAILGTLLDVTESARAEQQLRESEQKLRALTAHLETSREEERKRISREIHDDLGQMLTALKMDLAWLERRAGKLPGEEDRGPLVTRILEAASLVDQTVTTVQRIAAELRPSILDDLGLTAALEWRAQDFEKRQGIRCRWAERCQTATLGPAVATATFRIFQEILTNVARHAGATEINLTLRQVQEQLVLEVQDNGVGLPQTEIDNSKSLGLLGMRERAALVNGRMEFETAPGKGLRARFLVPVPQSKADA